MEKDPFKEYLKELEPDKVSKGYLWSTAIGLQAVDGLKPSRYLIDTAIENIEGRITLEEAQNLVDRYYEEKPENLEDECTEEADKVSARIVQILSENAFSFSPNEYISIHRRLFQGIYKHAGKMRTYNITKKEWILDGETVLYGSASELKATLEYDFFQEKNFSYKGLSMDETIRHLALFVSRLWQIHIFGEGNTRTTAVFFIKYLRTLGFSAANDIFAENAWYFRNALVRANYTNLKKGIYETTEYLEKFLRNLLLNEKNELRSRYLHIRMPLSSQKTDIEASKVDIQGEKVDIESVLSGKTDYQITAWSQRVVSFHIGEGAFCIDATMGNGGDTEFLCRLAGKSGRVLAFDVQRGAVDATKKRLEEKLPWKNYELILDSHDRMKEYASGETADCVMFNLGYLPGGDHRISTRKETTLEALNQALFLLKRNGILSICVYSGGDTGFEEKEAVLKWLKALDFRQYLVLVTEYFNRPNHPPIPAFVIRL